MRPFVVVSWQHTGTLPVDPPSSPIVYLFLFSFPQTDKFVQACHLTFAGLKAQFKNWRVTVIWHRTSEWTVWGTNEYKLTLKLQWMRGQGEWYVHVLYWWVNVPFRWQKGQKFTTKFSLLRVCRVASWLSINRHRPNNVNFPFLSQHLRQFHSMEELYQAYGDPPYTSVLEISTSTARNNVSRPSCPNLEGTVSSCIPSILWHHHTKPKKKIFQALPNFRPSIAPALTFQGIHLCWSLWKLSKLLST